MWGRRNINSLQDKNEYLRDGYTVKFVFVIVEDVRIRDANMVKNRRGIIRNMEKNENLSYINVPVFYTFANYIGKKLRNYGGGKRF